MSDKEIEIKETNELTFTPEDAAKTKPETAVSSGPASKKKPKKTETKPKAEKPNSPKPNIRYIGESGHEQSSLHGTNRKPIWIIPASVDQRKPFHHEHAALIVQTMPHLYAHIGEGNKKKISKGNNN